MKPSFKKGKVFQNFIRKLQTFLLNKAILMTIQSISIAFVAVWYIVKFIHPVLQKCYLYIHNFIDWSRCIWKYTFFLFSKRVTLPQAANCSESSTLFHRKKTPFLSPQWRTCSPGWWMVNRKSKLAYQRNRKRWTSLS